MLVIRLSRTGKKNKPQYRLVVQEKEWAPSSKAVEIVGHFNPHQVDAKPVLKEERVKYWLSQGAQPSNTVWNMLVEAKLVEGGKKKVVQPKLKKTEGEEEGGEAPKEEAKSEEKPAEEKKEEVKEEPKEEEKPASAEAPADKKEEEAK